MIKFYLFRDSHTEYSGYFLSTFKPRRDTSGDWSFCTGHRESESVILLGINQVMPILEKLGKRELKPGFGLDLSDGSIFNVKEADLAEIYS